MNYKSILLAAAFLFSCYCSAQYCPEKSLLLKDGSDLHFKEFVDSLITSDRNITMRNINLKMNSYVAKTDLSRLRSNNNYLDSVSKKNGLPPEMISSALHVDLVIIGEIVSQGKPLPLDRCTDYKTAHRVRIIDLIRCPYNLKTNDTIELRTFDGPVGLPCGTNAYSTFSHYQGYQLGESYLLFLSNTTYFNYIYQRIRSNSEVINDPLCENIFIDHMNDKKSKNLKYGTKLKNALHDLF